MCRWLVSEANACVLCVRVSAGDSEDDYVPAGDDIVTSEDDSASEGGDVGEPLPPPTTAGECEDNLGLISVGGSGEQSPVTLEETDVKPSSCSPQRMKQHHSSLSCSPLPRATKSPA